MTIFKDFSENGELLQIRDEPLNAINFPRYAKVNGIEQAHGYLEGMNLIQDQIENACFYKIVEGTPVRIYKYDTNGQRVIKFHKEKIQFLTFAKDLRSKPQEDIRTTIGQQKPQLSPSLLLDLYDFAHYLKEKGPKKTQGYLDAMEDMMKEIGGFLTRINGSHETVENSAYVIGYRTQDLLPGKSYFVTVAEMMLKPPESGKKEPNAPAP